MSPSSRGLGHCPFTAATGVRIPLGTPIFHKRSAAFYLAKELHQKYLKKNPKGYSCHFEYKFDFFKEKKLIPPNIPSKKSQCFLFAYN